MKEEALKLADEFDEMTDPFQSLAYAHKAQAMIRRLVEELDKQDKELVRFAMIIGSMTQEIADKQGEPVAWMWQELGRYKWDIGWEKPTNIKIYDSSPLYTKGYTTPQTKPLSDEEIMQIRNELTGTSNGAWEATLKFAKAIEERHGIK